MEAWKEELYHHGILGMKWGVRRFQRADGTRTAAGKKREAANADDASSKSDGKSETASYKHDDYKRLSTTELRDRLNRLNMEKQYKQLVPEEMSRGKKFIENYIKPAASELTKEYGKKLLRSAVDPYIDKATASIKSAVEANMKKQKED